MRGALRSAAIVSLAVSLAMSFLPGAAAYGQVPSDDDALGQLRNEVDRLRDDNARMQREIDELRASTSDDWLNETRSAEIRAIVHDVLADADVRASHLQTGLAAGWNEHFFLASPDGRFKLALDGQLQTRFVYSYHDQPDRHLSGFEITRAKLTLRGHVFNKNLTYLVRTDATRNEPGLVTGLYYVRDAWIGYQLDNTWSVRAGQFKLPFMREELVSSANQLAVERSLIEESMTLGRTQGVEFTSLNDTQKFMFAVGDGAADSLGGFGSLAGTNPPNTNALVSDVDWAFTARYEQLIAGEWKQFADFTSPPGEEFGFLIGFGAHAQETEYGTGGALRTEQRWTTATLDLSAEWGGANAFGSTTWAYIDHGSFGHITIWGATIQGGTYITNKVELFARWEYGWWDFGNTDFAALNLATFGVNYYIDGHDVKWTTDIGYGFSIIDQTWDSDIAGWRRDFRGNEGQVVFRTQFQLLF